MPALTKSSASSPDWCTIEIGEYEGAKNRRRTRTV